jgi:hypothetical protein
VNLSLHKIILLGMGALWLQAASADPIDAAAVQKARQIRRDVEQKQKDLAQEQRVEAPAAAAPAAPLELAIDETDSPGATK